MGILLKEVVSKKLFQVYNTFSAVRLASRDLRAKEVRTVERKVWLCASVNFH